MTANTGASSTAHHADGGEANFVNNHIVPNKAAFDNMTPPSVALWSRSHAIDMDIGAAHKATTRIPIRYMRFPYRSSKASSASSPASADISQISIPNFSMIFRSHSNRQMA